MRKILPLLAWRGPLGGAAALLFLACGTPPADAQTLGTSSPAIPLAAPPLPEDTLALATYRVALGQVLDGKADTARLLLEASAGAYSPEAGLLLASLQERAGDTAAARATLARVTPVTPLCTAYLQRLGGAPANLATAVATADFVPVTALTPAGSLSGAAIPLAAGAGAPSSAARLSSTDARIARLEKVMLGLVNEERTSAGLKALTWDEPMAEVGRAHSAEMRDKGFFAHESPTPALREPMDRYVAGIGSTPRIVAENIYRAWGSRSMLTDEDIATGHRSLMNSPGHRANLMHNGVTRIGIGIVADKTGNIWITQIFAKP